MELVSSVLLSVTILYQVSPILTSLGVLDLMEAALEELTSILVTAVLVEAV